MSVTTIEPEIAHELSISVEGKIISSNFEEFRKWAVSQIEAINFDLKTDEDFAQAKVDSDRLKHFEDTLSAKEEEMLKSLDDVYKLITGTRELRGMSGEKRIALTKAIKDKSDSVKREMITEGCKLLTLNEPTFRAMVEESIKGKRSLVNMQEAITQTVERINSKVQECRDLVDQAEAEFGESVIFGKNALLKMEPSALAIELERRVERLKADREKQRLIEQAEQAKKAAEAANPVVNHPVELPAQAVTRNEDQNPEPKVSVSSHSIQKVAAQSKDPASAELMRFTEIVLNAFAPVRQARLQLKDPHNIAKAMKFASALADAWEEFQEGGAK